MEIYKEFIYFNQKWYKKFSLDVTRVNVTVVNNSFINFFSCKKLGI